QVRILGSQAAGIAERVLNFRIVRRRGGRALEVQQCRGFIIEPQGEPAEVEIQLGIVGREGVQRLKSRARGGILPLRVERNRLGSTLEQRAGGRDADNKQEGCDATQGTHRATTQGICVDNTAGRSRSNRSKISNSALSHTRRSFSRPPPNFSLN